MKPRVFFVFVIVAACVSVWWQIESRLKTARELHARLSDEAAHYVNSDAPRIQAPNSTPPPDPYTIRW